MEVLRRKVMDTRIGMRLIVFLCCFPFVCFRDTLAALRRGSDLGFPLSRPTASHVFNLFRMPMLLRQDVLLICTCLE